MLTLLLGLSLPASAADLVIDGTSQTLDGTQSYDSVQIINGGVLYVTAYTGSGTTGTLHLLADSVTVDSSSSIVASGRGYRGQHNANGEGPGGGQGGSCCPDSGGGGGHGGSGGTGSRDGCGGSDGAGGSAYGSSTSLSVDMGSAGGAAGNGDGDDGGYGAEGGGSITIEATSIEISGTVVTDGDNGSTTNNDAEGGGAGGGILLMADTLVCTGTLYARGGNGGSTDDGGGGGGGGVIKQFYDSTGTLCGTDDSAGSGGCGAQSGSSGSTSDAEMDWDGDGYTASDGDCDTTDASSYPGASESCDGVDNDCDGSTDESGASGESTWYSDSDGDGYGDSTSSLDACDQPSGYVSDSSDCDDAEATTSPAATEICDGVDNDCDGSTDESGASGESTWYSDGDGDGYGDGSSSLDACDQPSNYVSDSSDCDDAEASTFPGATEVCDGVDNNCDGSIDESGATGELTWYADGDGDGFGDASSSIDACDQPSSYVSDSSDCDDAEASTYPGATEICDGVDNDCDGSVDESGASGESTWYADTAGDGFGDATLSLVSCDQPSGYVSDDSDCDDDAASSYPGATEICDGEDNNCDGDIDETGADGEGTWYLDTDGDGYGDASTSQVSCDQPSGYVAEGSDCDDTNLNIHPAATETCDGVDNNCDGNVDESGAAGEMSWYLDSDGDGFGDPDTELEACDQPSGYLLDASDCDDTDSSIYPGATDTWYDGIDSNCDGADDYDQDGDGHRSDQHPDDEGLLGDDCDDTDASIHPDIEDTWYDGIDSNCDGLSDYDADGDGYDSATYDGDDCDDANPDTYPGAPDNPYDGVINDCDSTSDYDQDGDGYESVEFGGTDCDDNNSSIHPDAEDTWYDGIDSNCDEADDYDQDGDGFTLEEDCDDEDADIYPGSPGWTEDCEPADTGDTGLDTGDSGVTDTAFDGDGFKGGGGCTCNQGSLPRMPWLILAGVGLFVVRRRHAIGSH